MQTIILLQKIKLLWSILKYGEATSLLPTLSNAYDYQYLLITDGNQQYHRSNETFSIH